MTLVEEAVEAHADVPLDEGDPASAALSTREKARAISTRCAARAGWKTRNAPERDKLVHFHPERTGANADAAATRLPGGRGLFRQVGERLHHACAVRPGE